MSQSLQDQLKALGLAKERPANKPGRKQGGGQNRNQSARGKHSGKPRSGSSHSSPKQNAGGQAGKSASELSLEQAYRLREKETRSQAERAKELKQIEDRKRRALNKQIKAIVDPNRLNDPAAELQRHFMYKGRIRKVNVNPEQLKALNEGAMGLVYLSGGYHLLDQEQVARVRDLSEEHVPDLSGPEEQEDEFPVPDDLVW